VSRGEGMKKEREEEREKEGSHILPVSHTMVVGVTPSRVAPSNMVRLHQCLMKHACQSHYSSPLGVTESC
jgi:hypothetical protein